MSQHNVVIATSRTRKAKTLSLDEAIPHNNQLQTALQNLYDNIDSTVDKKSAVADKKSAPAKKLDNELTAMRREARKLRNQIRKLHRRTDEAIPGCDRACCSDR